MSRILRSVEAFIRDEDAPTMVEYALLVALIALVVAAGAQALGVSLNNLFGAAAGSV